ncbi:MAG: HlyD family efflux transporter periplasmic adaptor subunit [Chryseobacterium sp.]|nr:HlyD family efflux transporter periplasmic adaptor subunit [Chryseobacterium sp.]
MRLSLITLLAISCCFMACKNKKNEPDNIQPKSTVTVVSVQNGTMAHTEQLSVTAHYLRRNTVAAPVAGYVHFVKINFNDHVTKGQLLYTIETKERKALDGFENTDMNDKNYGLINVYAPMSGIVTAVPQSQNGVFVSEGTLLCEIADNNSLYFQVNVPYEYSKFVKENRSCIITLPDSTKINAQMEKPIMQSLTGLQTIPYMAKPQTDIYIPEGIIATVQFITYHNNAAAMLPKKALLSDELMQKFWIMKLINDSTAVKIPVTIGAQNETMIEIKSPVFNSSDKILSSGNYGLSDTALVKVL